MSAWQKLRAGELVLLTDRELFHVGLALTAVLAVVFWVLITYIEPPPPKHVRMTTGGESGAYFAYGKKYAEAFAKQGITLEVLPSKGSVQNLMRLEQPGADVSIGLVQSGIGTAELSPELESLASVAYEPIWVFYKPQPKAEPITTLKPFAGKILAIGPEGSGSRVAAVKLLRVNGINAPESHLLDLSGDAAVQAVLSGKADAAILVAAADAPSVEDALSAGLLPVNFSRADAYTRLLPWLSKVRLPRGVISLAKDLPQEDIWLIAPTANLVVRNDLHPAIAYLLMEVASDVHGGPTIANGQHEFPSDRGLDFPQSKESQRYFKTGRPFLQRYLSFWLANLLERLAVTLLPALAIALPLVQLLPKLLAWREKSRILRLYHELELLDAQGQLKPDNGAAAAAHLNRIETELNRAKLGANHYIDSYNLKSHIDMLRARLAAR